MKRSAPLRRHTPLAPVNRKRRQSEWQRAYGSKKRVAWFKARPCLVCGGTPSENAHTVTGGAGRKADAKTIVPLCREHHRELHRIGVRSFNERHCVNIATWATVYANEYDGVYDTPAPRCELCGRHEVKQFGLCTTCLHPRTTRRTA